MEANPSLSFEYKDGVGLINGFTQNGYGFDVYQNDIENVFMDLAAKHPDLRVLLHILCSPCSTGSNYFIDYENGVQKTKQQYVLEDDFDE